MEERMRGSILRGLVVGVLIYMLAPATAGAGPLEDARTLIDARRYDEAVKVLEQAVAADNASAELYNELGIAYHWTKDYDRALKYYRQAAKLDKTYLTSPLPILDHFNLYDEMIQIGEAALSQGDTHPGVLTGLLNAYYMTGNEPEHQRVLGILKAQTYVDLYEMDYQRYVLAKVEVRAGRHEEAIAYIAQMTTTSLLQFMATASDFDPIAQDPRFIEMTK
ncbi:MAG: hypothetical protein CVT81_08335 [Alphaproteobacteria bacterium HGW-Alphaproteobacteria-3]|nr:MAG: hypothetical protein CVT81_08335 [Alphaproteobacteria bacterium HGW-Alphaproteobacteria-3]